MCVFVLQFRVNLVVEHLTNTRNFFVASQRHSIDGYDSDDARHLTSENDLNDASGRMGDFYENNTNEIANVFRIEEEANDLSEIFSMV